MRYAEYVSVMRRWAGLVALTEYGEIVAGAERYPLLHLSVPGSPVIALTAGFHGNEPAGPLTLLERLDAVVGLARARGVGLSIYPCINPTGFEDSTRYNRQGERPNNDLLRYEVTPGVWRGELGPAETFLRWAVHLGGPQETVALRAALEREPAPVAALDLHQDNSLRGRLAYAYAFGEPAPYHRLLRACRRAAGIAARTVVDEGQHLTTDEEGLIVLHDGSVTDYFWRRGSLYAATLETTVDTPLEACHEVHLAWIEGLVALAARS